MTRVPISERWVDTGNEPVCLSIGTLVLTPLVCGVPKRYERSVKRNSTRCSVPPGLRWCPNVAGRVMPPDGSAAAVNEVGRKNVAQWEIGFSDLTNLTRLQVAHQPRAL